MLAQRLISRLPGRPAAGLFDRAFRTFTLGSNRLSNAHLYASKNSNPFSGYLEKLGGASCLHDNAGAETSLNVNPQFRENLGLLNTEENVSRPYASSPYAMNRRDIETGRDSRSMGSPYAMGRGDIETGRDSRSTGSPYGMGRGDIGTGRESRSMNFVRGIIEENGSDFMRGSPISGYHVEQNADIVHIKLIRNNTFVTVTDSNGNKKAGASSGCLSEMKAKASRYAAEATAEHIGRLTRNMGMKSVVMKVNGFTLFKKKKLAILAFREGYTFSRGDQNPIVYIEDTTRRPHNGCRLRKKRRV